VTTCPHGFGNVNGYTNYRCRCADCRAAKAEGERNRRRLRKEQWKKMGTGERVQKLAAHPGNRKRALPEEVELELGTQEGMTRCGRPGCSFVAVGDFLSNLEAFRAHDCPA
jgi:hypothetical protein